MYICSSKKWSHCETVALWNSLGTCKTSSIPLRWSLEAQLSTEVKSVTCGCFVDTIRLPCAFPGGVLPMWWVIHMCRGFDPLFSLWQDRARSFWGIFLIHQQQSYLLGYKNYQFLQKSIFLAPNSIFSSIFLGPIFSGQRHTPISFQAEYPRISECVVHPCRVGDIRWRCWRCLP